MRRIKIPTHLVAVFISIGLLTGCAKPPPPPPPPPPSFVEHAVTSPGETLAVISAWYTGDAKNWKAIEAANPGLKASKIRVGDIINIPTSLVIKNDPLTKKAVQGILKKNTKAPSNKEAPSNVASTDAQAQKEDLKSPTEANTHKTEVTPTIAPEIPSSTPTPSVSTKTDEPNAAAPTVANKEQPSPAPKETSAPAATEAPLVPTTVVEQNSPAVTPSSAEKTRDDLIDEILNK